MDIPRGTRERQRRACTQRGREKVSFPNDSPAVDNNAGHGDGGEASKQRQRPRPGPGSVNAPRDPNKTPETKELRDARRGSRNNCPFPSVGR
ncbi:hypothetical protein BRADI_5g24693v3 [Brachypodium distachyon]|uniref:Uncharacterized protein n=1 Tax=Brachypodium distachyon TaxID=15368 RepID=A0A2K2CJ46_BRADI|nr:hypothetical protein BRADI_5g24693v3 [Brachypodium distachyon]